jgi:hypothetical protein
MQFRDSLRQRCAAPPLTAHARARARERGIRRDEIEIVHRLGRPSHAEGRFRITLDGIARPADVLPSVWSAAASVVLVETGDGRVVTVYRRSRLRHSDSRWMVRRSG